MRAFILLFAAIACLCRVAQGDEAWLILSTLFPGWTSSKAVNMSGPTAQFVKDTISQDNIVIFSKSGCPYCKMAKEVFMKMNKKYLAVELDNRKDGSEIQNVLGEITGARTVPRVFINGEFIGGGTDVKSLYESGKLEKILQKSP